MKAALTSDTVKVLKDAKNLIGNDRVLTVH